VTASILTMVWIAFGILVSRRARLPFVRHAIFGLNVAFIVVGILTLSYLLLSIKTWAICGLGSFARPIGLGFGIAALWRVSSDVRRSRSSRGICAASYPDVSALLAEGFVIGKKPA